jgi:hypothetical protein
MSKRPDTPLVEAKKENKWGQFDVFSVMAKSKISFQSIRKYVRFIWEVTSERMEANKVLDSSIIQLEGPTAENLTNFSLSRLKCSRFPCSIQDEEYF